MISTPYSVFLLDNLRLRHAGAKGREKFAEMGYVRRLIPSLGMLREEVWKNCPQKTIDLRPVRSMEAMEEKKSCTVDNTTYDHGSESCCEGKCFICKNGEWIERT